jgi:hypothetical protein
MKARSEDLIVATVGEHSFIKCDAVQSYQNTGGFCCVHLHVTNISEELVSIFSRCSTLKKEAAGSSVTFITIPD